MRVETTLVKQEANEVLGTKEKSLYYLIITNLKGEKLVVNVGEKTHDSVRDLNKQEEEFVAEAMKKEEEENKKNQKNK